MRIHWLHEQPWASCVYVQLEQLALCSQYIGEQITGADGKPQLNSIERVIQSWKRAGDRLDAYLIPAESIGGDISGGVRYGPNGSDYLSIYINQDRARALLLEARRLK
jgi:hypothetical protein